MTQAETVTFNSIIDLQGDYYVLEALNAIDLSIL